MAQVRKVRLQSDLDLVQQFCSSSPLCKVLECTNELLELLFLDNQSKNEKSFTIHFMTDYPEGTALCCEAGDVQVLNKPLPSIFCSIFTEFCVKHNITLPDNVPGSSGDTLDRQVSDCSYVTASDTDVLSDQYDEEEDEEDMGMMSVPHPLLEADLARVVENFSRLAVDYKLYPTIDEIDILLNVDVQCILDEDTASAWGVKIAEPIIVFMRFKCMSLYLDGVEPEIKVYQPSNKDNFCLGIQIRKILEVFIANQLKDLSCQKVEKIISDAKDSCKEGVAEGKDNIGDDGINQVVTDEAIARVMALGFDHQQAVGAIIKAKGDVGEASMMLSCDQLDEEEDDELFQKTPNLFIRQASSGAQVQFTDNEEDPKKIPSLVNGFLCQLMEYILQRIKTLNEFCVICDERHVFECSLLKPCVCTRTLCVFSFQTLGVMADAAEAIATDSDVVDLLVAMANAAVCSSRNSIIFDPYPSIVDPHNSNFLALDPKNKNFEFVKKILRVIIDYRQATIDGKGTHTKTEMDQKNPCAFPLMQWILASNRSHIVLLPPEKRIASMKTQYQFLLVSSPPAKEHAFQKAKSSHGSTYAFHGSSIENWHSIVRKGLLNASGTKFQMNGAAHGKGIYLSPLSSVSFGYTRGYYGKVKSDQQHKGLVGRTNLICMALCEVICQDIKKSGDIWVCPNEDHVCTRFFFVYDGGDNHTNVDTRNSDTQKEINHAISVRRMIKATA